MFTTVEHWTEESHQYLCLEPNTPSRWLQQLAKTYVQLRSDSPTLISPEVLEGLGIVDIVGIRNRLQRATLPVRVGGNFDVVRSDFGEVSSYIALEGVFSTMLGYKSVRDRETIQFTGRGIDAIGVEVREDLPRITLVLVETKVSDESASPPQVVDTATDCLRNQHLAHLGSSETCAKVWDVARKALNEEIRAIMLVAALRFQMKQWDRLELVCCCFLVRPNGLYSESDFGTFRTSPTDYFPASVRFIVLRTPDRIEPTVNAFHAKARELAGAEN